MFLLESGMLEKSLKKLPETSGVYIFKNTKGTPIYIGKAKNLKNRLSSYFTTNLEPKTSLMIKDSKHLTYIKVDSEFDAILLEARLVRKFLPKFNIELRDDKSPLYIGITKEVLPRILTFRKPQLDKVSLVLSFGPFQTTPRKILRLLKRIFPFSTHKPGRRPCLESQIGLCNPCSSEIGNNLILKTKYLNNVKNVRKILSGKSKSLLKTLYKEMDEYAKQEKFEGAQNIKNQIYMLENLGKSYASPDDYLKDPNLLEDIRNKELKNLEEILAKSFKLKALSRIECFDVAHLAGSYPTASMVTFINGEPDKSLYRHFRIYSKKTKSDTDMMREVFRRRLKHFTDWGEPDLVIVDGGKPQVTTAHEVIKNFPIVGLAKRYETIVIKKDQGFIEIPVPQGPVLNLLQRIRDESHRFSRRLHHKLVAKAIKNR